MSIKLELSDEQLSIIQESLDLYSRLLIGQMHILDEFLRNNRINISINNDKCLECLKILKSEYFPELNSYDTSYSMNGIDVNEKAKQGIDIHDVIRNYLSWKNNPEGGITVNFDTPFHYSKKTPLPLIHDNDDNKQ